MIRIEIASRSIAAAIAAGFFGRKPPAGLSRDLLAPQKAAAIKLLTALLTEALRSFAEQAIPANAPEAGHDEDHA